MSNNMIINKKIILTTSIILLSLVLSACQPEWVIQITENDAVQGEILTENVNFYIEKSTEETETIPLGQLFYDNDYLLIDEISLINNNDVATTFFWDEINSKASINKKGEIIINGDSYTAEKIEIKNSNFLIENIYSIMDIAPTIAYAMEWPPLPEALGEVRVTHSGNWENAVAIMLDGLQYEKLEDLINNGKLPFLEKLEMLRKGITIYPPITTSSTAAFLTSTTPQMNGVYGYGFRSTEKLTLFDIATQEGLDVIAVEGASLALNLRNAETILSGDRDGDGFSDDNVYENAINVIQTNMPGLLYIHFHEIDDMGHTHGPESDEYLSAIIRVDQYLAGIYDALPESTFIVIFSDHGMHSTNEGGNHGTLTTNDLIIPIIFLEK